MLHHFAHQAIDGRWHTVYRIPGCDSLNSVMEGPCKKYAADEADRLNREQEREHKAAMERMPAGQRPIPTGFYSDGDAA